MTTILKHHIGERGIDTPQKALGRFWDHMKSANGNRRLDPEEFITIHQVRQGSAARGMSGSFDIFYSVPSRILRK